MRTFAPRPATRRHSPSTGPAAPGRAPVPVRGEAAVPRFAHDFSRVPVHGRAPIRVQARLNVGAPGDAYEREAHRVAEQVTRMPVASGRGPGESARPVLPAPPQVSRKGEGAAGPAVSDHFHTSLGVGRGLDPATRSFFEPRFGHDFGQVRVHTGPGAARLAASLNAQAYTVGRDVVFGEGRYAPHTQAGRRLLAHELTHVVQQSGARGMLQRAENDTVPGCAALADSASDVDALVNGVLTKAVAVAGKPPSGDKVATAVRATLGADTSIGRTAIEDWVSAKLPATKQSLPAKSATKYAGVTYGIWSQSTFPILNPTMKLSGICVGSDKLGHFFQQGWTYQQTQASSGTAAAEEESERTEGGGYGLSTTGVYSNADQEANRQGGKFYRDLIASPSMKFAISSYISSRWSEVDNPNFYESAVGKQVWANLLTGNWAGQASSGGAAAGSALSLTLAATTTGAVAGTFTVSGMTGTGAVKGTIQYNTRTVRGENLLGFDTSPTPISGIQIDLDWVLGGQKGKAVLRSSGERKLTGSWGNGASSTDRGTWNVART